MHPVCPICRSKWNFRENSRPQSPHFTAFNEWTFVCSIRRSFPAKHIQISRKRSWTSWQLTKKHFLALVTQIFVPDWVLDAFVSVQRVLVDEQFATFVTIEVSGLHTSKLYVKSAIRFQINWFSFYRSIFFAHKLTVISSV